jgi:predicted transcriptional regulator of viral defense system
VGEMSGRLIKKVREFLKSTPVANLQSISALVGDKNYAYVVMNHLLKRGEIKRITRGYYTVHDDPSLLVYCLKPAYIGLQDAMSFHNLWEQETSPIIITSRKVRCGIRKVMGHNVLVRRISKEYLFGYEHCRHGDFSLPVSDVEKTFIDMAYFGEIERSMVREFEKRIDRKKLEGYLRKYPANFRNKVSALLSR